MAFIAIFFGGKELETVELSAPEMIVGRDEQTDIRIDNLGISRRHCSFTAKGPTHMVKDLGSSNGTFVNGKKVAEHFLNNGDEIVLGKYLLVYKNSGQDAAASDADIALTGGGGIPDSVNTFAMDGTKLRERIEQMRKDQLSGKRPLTETAEMGGKGDTRVISPLIATIRRRLSLYKTLFVLSLLLNVILIILIILTAASKT